jgi:transcriptional adapter 2-alpha
VDIKENHNDFDISTSRGYDLLSRREADLCVDLKIYPVQYLEIKKALIQESLTKGLLEKEGPGSGRRIVVKMDIQRRGDVIDFLLRAGWISSRLAQVARTVTPPPSTAGDD